MKSNQDIINTIGDVDAAVYDRHGVDCRQYGDKYIHMVLDMASGILDAVKIDDITPDLLDELTENNLHQARHACEMLLSLDKYSMRQYIKGV